MADFGVAFDGFFSFDGVDLSNKVISIDAPEGTEEQDASRWGTSTRIGAAGLKTGSITVTLVQDYATGSVDATIRAKHSTRATAVAIWRPAVGAVSTTNPQRTVTTFVRSYNPLSGRVGDYNTATLELGITTEIVVTTS